MDDESYRYFFVLAAVLSSALFSGFEIAFISANKLKIELENKKGTFSGKILSQFQKKPSTFIGSMLLGNNLALVFYGIFMADSIEPIISRFFFNSSILVFVLQTVISTAFILVFAEFLPKALFRINSNRVLTFAAIPLFIVYWILYPLNLLVLGLSSLIFKVLGVDIKHEKLVFGKIELDNYVKEQIENEYVKEEELDNEVRIFQNALDFSALKVRECMVPRTEIISINITGTIEELNQQFIQTGFSKVLVYKNDIDNIIGYAHSYEMFKQPNTIKSILRPISFIPETASASDVLEQIMKQRRMVAVVVDEFGGTSGIVTIEDVMEQIFGDIEDEHDTEELIEEKLSDDSFLFSARLDVENINQEYKLNLPVSEEYETLGGMVIQYLEDIPDLNEEVLVEDYSIIVKEVENNRIILLKISKQNIK